VKLTPTFRAAIAPEPVERNEIEDGPEWREENRDERAQEKR